MYCGVNVEHTFLLKSVIAYCEPHTSYLITCYSKCVETYLGLQKIIPLRMDGEVFGYDLPKTNTPKQLISHVVIRVSQWINYI